MAKITCPHCSEVINLASTMPGRYQCPHCNEFFKIAKKQPKPQSLEIRTNTIQTPQITQTAQFNPDDVVLPKSTIFWHNAKLVVLTPIGLWFIILGIVRLIEDASGIGLFLSIIPILFGTLFMLPAFYNSKDLKNKKTEYMLKSTSQILPGQTISSPSKSVSRQILLILLVLMIVGLVLYLWSLTSVLLFPNIDCRRRWRRVLMTLLQIKTV